MDGNTPSNGSDDSGGLGTNDDITKVTVSREFLARRIDRAAEAFIRLGGIYQRFRECISKGNAGQLEIEAVLEETDKVYDRTGGIIRVLGRVAIEGLEAEEIKKT